MTLVVCWERIGHDGIPQLVLASDSRLSGGERWDACPKIFSTGRPDVVLAFAGETQRAYPILLSVVAGISSYASSANASTDIGALASQALRVANSMLTRVTEAPAESDWATCEFVVAGWSWKRLRFEVHVITPQSDGHATRRFRKTVRTGTEEAGCWAVIGDGKRQFMSMFGGHQGFSHHPSKIGWGPLTDLAKICADKEADSVGGIPQLTIVLRSPRVEQFAVTIGSETAVAGRPLEPNEAHDLPEIKQEEGQYEWRVCR